MGRSWPGDVEKEECFQRKGEERRQLSTAGGEWGGEWREMRPEGWDGVKYFRVFSVILGISDLP